MINHIEKKENWHEGFIVNLAAQLRPQIYVELGLYHCELFNAMIPYSETLIGVDISPEAGKYMYPSEKVMFMNMSTDEFAELLRKYPVPIDLLFIDADHSKESVLKDFWNYFPFVKEQGLILLHDTYPKNRHYTNKGYCGDAYLVVEELKNHLDEFEFVTIPVHPGLTIVRKRKTQLAWEDSDEINHVCTSRYFERNLSKSLTMPSLVSKFKQMIDDEKEINTIVEIGSPDPNDLQYIKKFFPDARIIAIEALPENYEKYLKPLNNIETINAVVSHIDGEITFYKKEVNGIHNIYNRVNEYGDEELKLPSYRFETLARIYNINKVDILKLDAEGATFEVLESMGSLLSTVKVMHIEIESYPFYKGQNLHSDVVSFLEQKGFTLVELTSFPIQPGKLQYDSIWINNNYLNEKLTMGE